jgi:hypothetical protein
VAAAVVAPEAAARAAPLAAQFPGTLNGGAALPRCTRQADRGKPNGADERNRWGVQRRSEDRQTDRLPSRGPKGLPDGQTAEQRSTDRQVLRRAGR